MSGYYRRVIANRILRSLSKHRKLAPSEAEQLERNVALLVRTCDIQKTFQSEGNAQLRLDFPDLAKVVGHVSPEELTDLYLHVNGDNIKCRLDKKGASISLDTNQFNQNVLHVVQTEGSRFGSVSLDPSSNRKPRNVIVEYSSPNIAKPFHAGHLRSTIIGNFIANLYHSVGDHVTRLNYLGDWGTQFGLLGLGFQRYGDEQLLKEDPLLHLFQVYVKVNENVEEEKKEQRNWTYRQGMELFTKLEQGDPIAVDLWQRFRDLSLHEYTKMYQRLGVSFTQTQYESQYSQHCRTLAQSLRDRGLLKNDENGVGYMMVPDRENEIKATLIKSDGSSLYLTRDVAAALDRQSQFAPDIMHYVVEGGQELHFRQLVGVLRQLGVPWATRPVQDVHIKFGRIEGMSSRRGTVVFLRDILDEARDRLIVTMKEKATTKTKDVEKVADILAVSAVAVQDLKGRRQHNYKFSWERMLSLSGDSGVFVQYAHARLSNLLALSGVKKTLDVDVACLNTNEFNRLIQHMAKYPEVVEDALVTLEPCFVVQYLLKLCNCINGAYKTSPVKGQAADIAQARVLAFDSARQVLFNGMKLLGMQPVTEM